MQPCSREMQSLTATSAAAQMALHELQNGHPHHHQIPPFDHPAAAAAVAAASDDFLDQMLSTLPSSWPDLDGSNAHKLFNLALSANNKPSDDPNYYDESTLLASRLRQHQISGGGGDKSMAALQLGDRQQPVMLSQIGISPVAAGESGLLPLPLSLGNGGGGGEVDGTFKSPNSTGGSESGLYNGFAGSLQRAAAQAANQQQHFHQLQPQQGFGGAPAGGAGQAAPAAPAAGGVAAPPRQRVRARRGQATDPHSIAERLRRERIAERMKALQELVPNANKTDKASMLDEIIDYVKFLQLQVKVLSMSRLGGAAAVAPLVSDISSEGPAGRGGSNGSGAAAAAASDSLTVTEHQVAKLMEEDMGSAMQYLQGKGLCLMPISLASAISTATCHPRAGPGAGLLHAGNGDGPTSPSMSVLTVQSAVAGGADAGENASRSSVAKDAASVSKP